MSLDGFEQIVNFKEILQWFGISFLVLFFVVYKYMMSVKHNRDLKKSLKSFEMLMESTIEGILVFDTNGICIHSNRVAAKIFGYEPKEMIGKSADVFVSEQSKNFIKEKMKNYNQEPYEAIVMRKDKTEFPAILRGRTISWNNQRVRISTIIDISDIKKLQYNLEELNQNLEEKVALQIEDIRQKDQMLQHQNKLASMGEMIGAIAHQWRQPLNAININIENLDDDFEDGLIDREFINEFIDKNRKMIEFMSKTIDDFRDFYKIDKSKEPFSIKEAIKTTTEIKNAHFEGSSIDITVVGEDIWIDGYKREFEHVILNLLNNAVDAINNNSIYKGKIEITLDKKSVSIQDNGGGIDQEVIERIFEPYFTTKDQGDGTGIGLYMSKVIIEKNMGGKLFVENCKKGAKFTIVFDKVLEKTQDSNQSIDALVV